MSDTEVVRFRVKDKLTITGVCVVLIGRLETGVVRLGDTLLLMGEEGPLPVLIERIEVWPPRSLSEAWPDAREYGIGVTGIRKDQVGPQALVTSVAWGGARCRDLVSTEDLWKALDTSGASERYTLLLHGISIDDLEPFFETAARVVGRPDLVAPLILDRNWRVTILGAALAAILGSARLAGPLTESLQAGSWVAPQLAAALAALPGAPPDLSGLRPLLASAGPLSDPKHVLSAYAALSLRNDSAVAAFERTEAFAALWSLDHARSYALAARWRGIWGVAGPYFRTRVAGEKETAGPFGPVEDKQKA